MKKLICALLIGSLMSLVVIVPAYADTVATSAAAYALYCPDNGEVLFSENADRELPIASITKIMTTLLTLEYAERENMTVTFTEKMIAEGSSMYLKVGEQVTLRDLAVGMMMQSGNDAANAAAISVGGSIEGFAKLMNDKAQEIGMEHTHFVTPSGLDDDDHYSCARDMALLMAYAMQNEDFAAITSQTSMTVDFVEPSDKRVTYPNHNRLLSLYPDCLGGKTGYTDRSGRTLVTAARRDGLTLIAVTLDDHDDWDDHIALYEAGFARYTAVALPSKESFAIDVVGGTQDILTLAAGERASAVIPRDKADQIKTEIYLPAFVYAPVEEGAPLGQITYTLDGEVIGIQPLTASQSIPYNSRRRGFIAYIKDIFNWHS